MGLEPPKEVGVGEAGEQRVEVGGDEFRVGVVLAALGIDAEDAAKRILAQRGLVGIALAVLGIVTGGILVGRGVVLDDEVIPIRDPDGAVGAGPTAAAGVEVVRGLRGNIARALGGDFELADELAGGFADEGDAVAVIFREAAGGVK